jgi:uncharacterized phage protein (TIGR02218 family)
MTFKALEWFKKNQPVEFYEITRGGVVWRFTSADQDVTYGGNVFASVGGQIKRSAIVWSGDLAQANVRITLPVGHEVVDALTGFPLAALVKMRIFAQHRGQNDTVSLMTWRYVNYRFKGAECELRFDSNLTARREQGLRRTASPMCPHTLYDTKVFSCGVVKALYKVTLTPSFVGGAIITGAALASHPDGYFDGGLCEVLRTDGILEERMIDTHVGNTITLRAPIPGLIAGVPIDVYPGCDHSLEMCHDRFNNSDNHGGLPFVPEENPYDGHPIF